MRRDEADTDRAIGHAEIACRSTRVVRGWEEIVADLYLLTNLVTAEKAFAAIVLGDRT